MDISGIKVDSIIKVEKLNPTLRIGGDNNSQNLSVAGNLTINQVYTGTVSPQNPDLVARKVDQLTSGESTVNLATGNQMQITVSPFMGIVKSPEMPGTRIHLEFAIANNNETPKIINGAYVKLNEGKVHFKKFFKINPDSSRAPDFTTRFPLIITTKGATTLAIEFENVQEALIASGKVKGVLYILTGDETVASKEFILDVNAAMDALLKQFQDIATKNNAPLVFDAQLES